jgi:hypothetical protein
MQVEELQCFQMAVVEREVMSRNRRIKLTALRKGNTRHDESIEMMCR